MTVEEIEKKGMSGEEKPITAGRVPFEMEPGQKYKFGLRGLGMYEGGYKVKDFQKGGERTTEKIMNAALIVCNPKDVSEEFIISATVDSVMGKSILNMGVKDQNGVHWLDEKYLNTVGWLGSETKKTREEYNRGYVRLFWDPEMKKGKQVMVENAPATPATVGAAQREVVTETGSEGVI